MKFKILKILLIAFSFNICSNTPFYKTQVYKSKNHNITGISGVEDTDNIIASFLDLESKAKFYIAKNTSFSLSKEQLQDLLSFYYNKNKKQILICYKQLNNTKQLASLLTNNNFDSFKQKKIIQSNLETLLKNQKYELEALSKNFKDIDSYYKLKKAKQFFKYIKQDKIEEQLEKFINKYKNLNHDELNILLNTNFNICYQELCNALKYLTILNLMPQEITNKKLLERGKERLHTKFGKTILLTGGVSAISYLIIIGFFSIQWLIYIKLYEILNTHLSDNSFIIGTTIFTLLTAFIINGSFIISSILTIGIIALISYYLTCTQQQYDSLGLFPEFSQTPNTLFFKKLISLKNQSKDLIDIIYPEIDGYINLLQDSNSLKRYIINLKEKTSMQI